jgi:tetratricopeptide (TPR) repeat protein
LRGRALFGLFQAACLREGFCERTAQVAMEALEVIRRAGDAPYEAQTLGLLAVVEHNMGRLEDAERRAEEALDAARRCADPTLEGRTIATYLTVVRVSRLCESLPLVSRALTLASEAGARSAEAFARLAAAIVHRVRGELEQATEHLERALSLGRYLGYDDYVLRALSALGEIAWVQGDAQTATAHSQAAATLLKNNPANQALLEARLAAIAAEAGRLEESRRRFSLCEPIAQQLASAYAQTIRVQRGHLELAEAMEAAGRGDDDAARQLLCAAEARVREAEELRDYQQVWLLRVTTDHLRNRIDASRRGDATPRARLTVNREAMWFELAGKRVSCRRRPVTRRLVEWLTEQYLRGPGVPSPPEALIAAAWPGERMQPSSAKNRLYVALSELRKLGFRSLLAATEQGYFLDPAHVVASFETDDEGGSQS